MFFGSIIFATEIINPELNSLFFLGVTLSAIGIYALRALYFSIMREGYTYQFDEAAVGIISFVGYTPIFFRVNHWIFTG